MNPAQGSAGHDTEADKLSSFCESLAGSEAGGTMIHFCSFFFCIPTLILSSLCKSGASVWRARKRKMAVNAAIRKQDDDKRERAQGRSKRGKADPDDVGKGKVASANLRGEAKLPESLQGFGHGGSLHHPHLPMRHSSSSSPFFLFHYHHHHYRLLILRSGSLPAFQPPSCCSVSTIISGCVTLCRHRLSPSTMAASTSCPISRP